MPLHSLSYNSAAVCPMDDHDLLALLDGRHMGVTLFFERPIEAHNFANWSMGFRNLEHADPAGFAPFLE